MSKKKSIERQHDDFMAREKKYYAERMALAAKIDNDARDNASGKKAKATTPRRRTAKARTRAARATSSPATTPASDAGGGGSADDEENNPNHE